ncbi:MAG: GntR family transcriptional regulator [Verrucomicrobiae bacterium]|nr:GntR family transcriptional regulator [Verrucomicrobiae bacterium]
MSRLPKIQDRLFNNLQRKILQGEFAPGSRIPSRGELARSYRASPITIQRVFDRLVADGYVQPRGRNGSFVTDAPPHLHHYWLIFQDESSDCLSPFRSALTREAQKLSRKGHEVFSTHIGHGGNFRQGNYKELLHDVTTHRTAGLIFSTAGNYWNDTPLRKEPGLPRVAFSHGPEGPEDLALIRFDRESFFTQALDRLRALGRKRVAVLACALPTAYRELFLRGVAQRGMETRPYWMQFIHSHGTVHARGVVHLLLHPEQSVRPDALLILDDAMIEPATAGLAAAGVRMPEELTVIGHTNFPHPVECASPVEHLGYDLSAMLTTCLAVLAAQRAGTEYAHVTLVPARWADAVQPVTPPTP